MKKQVLEKISYHKFFKSQYYYWLSRLKDKILFIMQCVFFNVLDRNCFLIASYQFFENDPINNYNLGIIHSLCPHFVSRIFLSFECDSLVGFISRRQFDILSNCLWHEDCFPCLEIIYHWFSSYIFCTLN